MHINVKSYSSDDLLMGYEPGKDGRSRLLVALGTGLMFWLGLIGFVFWIAISNSFANGSTPSVNDPMVLKVYPDGTKVILRWSEVGKSFDNGSAHGGAPKILAYDPAKDGVVPIGESNTKPTVNGPTTNSYSSMVSSSQPSKISNDYTPKESEPENLGPSEGFGLRTDVGVAFQQNLSGREGAAYYTSTFQPGIRFDIEPHYNVTEWFAIGVETAFVHNSIHSISVDDDTFYRGSTDFGNGDLYQVPILLNTRFQFPTEGPLRGFFGAGVGGNWNFVNIATTHDDGTPYDATSYQWNYAFELSAGIRYTIVQGLDLNASFKTLCTPNPIGEDQNGQQKASYNYAAELGLAWRF